MDCLWEGLKSIPVILLNLAREFSRKIYVYRCTISYTKLHKPPNPPSSTNCHTC